MNKVLLTAAAFGLALTFSACSDSDSSSSSGGSGNLLSCDAKVHVSYADVLEMNIHACAEMENNADNKASIDENCVSKSESEEGAVMKMTAKKGSGCAGGAVLSCTDEDGNTVYYYDKAFAGKSCDDAEESFGF